MGYDLNDEDAARAYWTTLAPEWDAWSDHLAPLAERFNTRLIEAAEIDAGQSVLDLASGAGEPALTLARHVGPTGSVTATDLVPEMLAGARRRVETAGFSNVSFEICGMDELPFGPSTFHAATCRFGLMFTADPVAALSSIRNVLMPGGRAACMVWGARNANTMFEVLQTVVPPLLGEEVDEAESPMFRFAEKGSLNDAFSSAGYEATDEIELEFTPEIDADEPFWRPLLGMSLGHTITELPAETRQKIDATIHQAFKTHLSGGTYRLSVHARIGVGTVPGT